MNNKMTEEQVDQLYDIALRMKKGMDDSISYAKINENIPSHSMTERVNSAKEEYLKAYNDFEYFVNNYIVFKEKEEN